MLLKQAISSRVLLMMMMANTSTETSCGVELWCLAFFACFLHPVCFFNVSFCANQTPSWNHHEHFLDMLSQWLLFLLAETSDEMAIENSGKILIVTCGTVKSIIDEMWLLSTLDVVLAGTQMSTVQMQLTELFSCRNQLWGRWRFDTGLTHGQFGCGGPTHGNIMAESDTTTCNLTSRGGQAMMMMTATMAFEMEPHADNCLFGKKPWWEP